MSMEISHPELKCSHSLSPIIYTSKKEPHLGRQFYRCPKPIGEQCSFFLWVDEAHQASRNQESPTQNTAFPLTPQSSQSTGPKSLEPPCSPTPSSSRKRSHPDDLSWQNQKHPRLNADDGNVMVSEVSDELSAGAIEIRLRFFLKLPEHIRELERRNAAAVKNTNIQAKKITHLEAEIERLKQRQREPEELIQELESYLSTVSMAAQHNLDTTGSPKEKCRCGLEAAIKISSTGRKYLGCSRRAAAGQCAFTRMLPDENALQAHPTNDRMSKYGMPESLESDDIVDPNIALSTGMPSPMKRSVENQSDSSPLQKRARTREAVLREFEQQGLSPVPQRRNVASSKSSARSNTEPTNPSPMLPARSDTPDCFDMLARCQEVRPESIALHVNSSQSIGRVMTGSPSLDSSAPSSRVLDADTSWLLQEAQRSEFGNTSGSIMISPKRLPVQPSKEGYKEAVTAPEGSSSTQYYSARSMSQVLEGLSGLPQYLRTMEKGLEIKDMKIRHLENEVERLKSKQEELEKLLRMYDSIST